jgi:sirohydrochlorin ferrochelatase
MRSLLLVAHGSRRRESNEEVRRLTLGIEERAGKRFDLVDCAFLELARPSIGEGIDAAAAKGASEITVLPYFLAAGTHVVNDIPEIVEDRRRTYPAVCIQVTPHMGAAPALPDLLLGMVLVADR